MGIEADVVLGFVEHVLNARQLDRIGEFLADDFRTPPGDDGLDRAGFALILQYYFDAFSDLHYTVEEVVDAGDTVVLRMTMVGIHDGVYDGQTGTGRRVSIEEVDLLYVVDNRIAALRIAWDELGFRRQLGLPLSSSS